MDLRAQSRHATVGSPFQGFRLFRDKFPGRCPGLLLDRPFGALGSAHGAGYVGESIRTSHIHCGSANGAALVQPRATPWVNSMNTSQALKGRANLCLNLSLGCTSTSSSAPKAAKPFFAMPYVILCMPTWQRSYKILAALRCSSIPSRTTSISFLNLLARWPSARPWRKSKRLHGNGSRRRARNVSRLRGRPGMGRLRFRNRMSPRYGNTSQTSANITGRNPSRRNTGLFSNDIELCSMRNMFGIRAPFQGWGKYGSRFPRALPWAGVDLPLWGLGTRQRRGLRRRESRRTNHIYCGSANGRDSTEAQSNALGIFGAGTFKP